LDYIGCNIDVLRQHIEKQFVGTMSWKNQGEWHIDHITPILYRREGIVDRQKIIKRLHFTNLQPLWAVDNMSKGNRFVGR
jgi:hypothetical protein